MLNKIYYLLVLVFCLSAVSAQTPNFRILQKEQEWQEYTSFQRDELIAFCRFLYSGEQYDRAVLGYFQFLFRFPGDTLDRRRPGKVDG